MTLPSGLALLGFVFLFCTFIAWASVSFHNDKAHHYGDRWSYHQGWALFFLSIVFFLGAIWTEVLYA